MSVWRGSHPLILASQSRTRQMLLTNAGIVHDAMPAPIDERAVQRQSGLTKPADIAVLLAEAKARAIAAMYPGRIVLGADQTLALGERLFNKPTGRVAAAEQLGLLAGRTHELHSAIALVSGDEVLFRGVSVARMTMRPLTPAAIGKYLDAAGDTVTSSVGAYQLEGFGVHLFERIDGDHFTILGLPLMTLLPVLRDKGLIDIG